MKQWMLPFLVVVISVVSGQDKCGNRCQDGQICFRNATCVDRSDLKHCGLWYCKKSEDCCGLNKCIPKGANCCPEGVYYFPPEYTCCGDLCCPYGYYCIARRCTLDNSGFTTKKVTTTSKPTTESRSEKPTFRPPIIVDKTYSRFLWLIGLITGLLVVITVVAVGIIIWKYRSTKSNASGRSGSGGQLLGVPEQTRKLNPSQISYIITPKTSIQPYR